MEKIFVVQFPGWTENEWINFSFHKTEKGAQSKVEEANKKYNTSSAFVNDYKVEE